MSQGPAFATSRPEEMSPREAAHRLHDICNVLEASRMRELAAAIVSRPECPADLAEELRLIDTAPRNHAYTVDSRKRDEIRAELEQL